MKKNNLYTELSMDACTKINGGCFAHDAGTAIKLLFYSTVTGGTASVIAEYSAESASGEYDH